MNSFKFLSFILILLPLPGWAQVPASFVYQGQITKSGGVPLEANPVIFNVRVYSPVNDCLMYEEQHSINMLGSEGIFSLNVGAGIRSGSDFEDTSSIIDIFKNGINHTGITTCSSGSSYTAIAGHTRKVRISYNDGSGQVTLAQDFHLQTVPYAWYANSLQGLTATNFVQINVGQNITQSNLENLLGGSNYNTLFNLASGTSTSPLSLNNQQIKNLADPTLAQDAATKNYTDTKIAGSNIDVSGVGAGVGDGRVLSWNATLNRWEATTPSALSDATKLPLAGGTMAGNINMNGNQVLNTGHLTMQNLSTITLGKFSNAQEVTLVGTLAAGNKGATWYNSDTDQIMYWDGNSAEAVGSGSGTGDIEAIVTNAGSALSGGVNSGSATLSVVTDGVTMETNGTNQLQVKDAGISAAKLATDAVDSTKIVDGSLVNADINAGAGIAWSKINKTGAIASEVGAVAPARAINTNTGSGLTGGGDLSADRSLAINTDNSSVEISTNTLQVKDAGITNAKIVSVGVAKVTSAAAEYFSYMPAGTECSPNNTLIWDAVNDRWVCGVLPSSFSFVADADNDTKIQLEETADEDKIRFDTAGSERMIIDEVGRVGIGTTTPDTKLHISGTSGATLKIVDGNQATGRVLTSDANGVASWAVAGAASAAGANTQIQYNNSGSLGASSKFVWNNTLNILGLSASAGGYPTVALSYDDGSGDVQQSSLTAGGLTTTMGGNNYGSVSLGHDNLTLLAKTGAGDWPRLLMKTASSSGGYLTSGSAMGSLKFGGYNDLDGAGVRAVASETHNVSSRGTHLFISSTPNGSTTPVSRIAILQNGNVGIGTTAPERLLHVNGVLRMTASTTPGAPAAGDIFVDSADSNKLKYYNGSAWVEAGGGGGANLGAVAQNVLPAIDSTYDLGSASHYWQNGYVRNLTAGDITAYFTVNADKFTTMGGGSQTAAAYSNSGDPNNGIFFPAADVTAFTTNNVERLRINSSGNVGIGTTVPNEKLQVAGNIRAIADNSSGYVVSYADVYSNNTGESGFFISRRGRGTMSSPSYPQTGDQLGGISFRSYNSTVGPRMSGFATENQNAGAQGGALILTTVANGGITEFERVRITQDGNMGIGTNNPVAKLEVSGNLKIGSDNTTCDSTRLGTMRFENDFLFVCKSTGWAVVQTTSPVAALSVAPSSATLDLTGGVSPGGYTSFTFTNSGSATTSTIATNLSNTTNFQIGSNTCASATLSPGSNCIIQVRAIASSNTTYSGTVSATAGAASASASLSGTSTGFSASPPDCSLFTSPEPNTAGYMYFPVSTTQKVMTMCTFSGMTSTWVTNSGSCWGTGCWTSPASSPRTGTGGVEFDVSNSLVPGFDKIYRCNAGIVQMSTSGGAFVNQNWSGGAQNGQPLRCVSY